MNWNVASAISKLVVSTQLDARRNGLQLDVLAETRHGSTIGIECKDWRELTPEIEIKAQHQVELLEGGVVDRAFIVVPELPDDRQTKSVRNLRGLAESVEAIVDAEPEFAFRGPQRFSAQDTKSRKNGRRLYVAMPFATQFEDTYYLGIVPAADRASASCTRADEPHFNEHVLDIMHKAIRLADLVLVDLTGANANVAYEMGYAHALEKPMIHISVTPAEQLPFNFRQWPIVIYELGQVHRLQKRLADLMSAHFANKSESK